MRNRGGCAGGTARFNAIRCPAADGEQAVYPVASPLATQRDTAGEAMTLIDKQPRKVEAERRVRAVWISIVASFFVCLVEISLGWMLGLESLLAEGVHTFFDGAASVIVMIAVVKAAKPADQDHQFGHGKFEALGATVEGAFVFCAAIGIAYYAVGSLYFGEVPEKIPFYVCVVMAVTSVFYWLVSAHLLRVARHTRSPAVFAEAMHLRTHIYVTGGLAGGLLIGRLGGWLVADSILAMGVAICLFVVSFKIFREVLKQFTDAALPAEEIEELRRIVGKFENRFINVHGIRTRMAGAERLIEMHLVVMPETSVRDAHALCEHIEEALSRQWHGTRATIHIEPLDGDREEPRTLSPSE